MILHVVCYGFSCWYSLPARAVSLPNSHLAAARYSAGREGRHDWCIVHAVLSSGWYQLLEELALNGWPALQTVFYDGWLLRFADGYTRRANSVNPLHASLLPLEEKLEVCRAVYAARGQAVIYKLADGPQHAELDRVLERTGHPLEASTSVQTADLADQTSAFDPAVTMSPSVSDTWLDDFCSLSGTADTHRQAMRSLLQAIAPAHVFASLRVEGEVLAAGVAVCERDYVGLFDIVTASHARNRGLGRRLVGHLLAWGQARGARAAHLAVMVDNLPALRLYAGFGFREAYRYWYRVERHPEFVIRQAASTDLSGILACVRAAYAPYIPRIGREPAPMHADYSRLVARGEVWVLDLAGTIAGVLVLVPEPAALLIENVAVHPRYQGRGLGGRLLTFAEDMARTTLKSRLRLYTNETMAENLSMYRHLGYQEEARREDDGYQRVFLTRSVSSL